MVDNCQGISTGAYLLSLQFCGRLKYNNFFGDQKRMDGSSILSFAHWIISPFMTSACKSLHELRDGRQDVVGCEWIVARGTKRVRSTLFDTVILNTKVCFIEHKLPALLTTGKTKICRHHIYSSRMSGAQIQFPSATQWPTRKRSV